MIWIKKALQFLNLLDNEGKISITNISIFLVLLKGLATSFGMQEVVVFIGLLMNYVHKRYVNNKAISDTDYQEQMQGLLSVIDGMKEDLSKQKASTEADIQSFKESHDKMTKQAEEVKKLISESNISRAFNPRNKML